MTAKENLLAQIWRLVAEEALPRSACNRALLEWLRPLIDAGVVAEERAGGGRRLVVCDMSALQEFTRNRFPDAVMRAGVLSRAAGVGRFRNSKTFASDTPEIVSVRAWNEPALTKRGRAAGAAAATAEHGVFSFFLAGDYCLSGPCALVENPAVFAQFEEFRLPEGLVIYGHGRASNRLIDWLAETPSPDFQLLHLPDYDPVGLVEFERLRARLGTRVRLHLPEDLDQQFARFSNADLLRNPTSQSMLRSLRHEGSAEVQRVAALIDRHNAGLEQEALLLR